MSFGRMGSPDSFLFDLKALLSITITGQVLLSKLIEDIIYDVPGSEILQVNTDGVTIRLLRTQEADLKAVCAQWEKDTNLVLEFAYYDRMAIRDVNNYCALSGKHIKTKGDFEIDKEAHKNHSQRVVAIATVLELLADIPAETTILNHLNTKEYTDLLIKKLPIQSYGIYDYCNEVRARGEGKKGKAKLYSENVLNNTRTQLQKINRYYISNTSTQRIVKCYDDGSQQLIHASKGVMCTVINKVVDMAPSDINYKYYVNEARKLVESIKGNGQLTLF